MRQVTWKNEAEQTCILTIQDERNDTVDMVPGGEPFMTSIQQTTEFFTPIRTASGYIRVEADSVDDVADLVGSTPLRRAVELQVEGVVRWRGFLACESFTQAWDVMPSLELPVMSPLEASRGVRPSADIDKLGYISFAKFLCDFNSELGEPYDNFYFPTISEPSTTLKYLFTMQNYATATDKNTAHEMSDYYSILEGICKLFGWQCIEWETSLVFIAGDVKALETGGNNFRGYTAARLAQLAAGTNDDPTDTPAFTPTIPVIYGSDHRMTYMAGKKSVEVTGQLGERESTIWSLNINEQCVYKGSEQSMGTTLYAVKRYGAYENEDVPPVVIGNIRAYNSIFGVNDPDTEGYNIKYHNYMPHSGQDAYGGCVTYEELAVYSGGEVVAGSADFVPRIILKAYSIPIIGCLDIYTNFFYDPSQNKSWDAFKLSATVKKAANAGDIFNTPSGTIYLDAVLMIKNGSTIYYFNSQSGWSTTFASILVVVKDGEIIGYGHETTSGVVHYGYMSAPTNISGEVVLEFLASTSSPYGQGTDYISIENLEIKLYTRINARAQYIALGDRPSENKKKINFSNGFTDSWNQDSALTLARENVPDSLGVVLAADRTLPPNLYDGKWPEDAMADRAATYFSKARLKIEAIVESVGKMLSPLVPYWFIQDGKQYICMEQQLNWKTNEVTAGFFEPTYEDE